MIFRFGRSDVKRYAVSVLSVAVADILTIAIEPLFHGKAPLFFFIAAAVLSAGYGGTGPGLLATGLGAGTVLFFFQPDIMVLAVAHSSVILFGVLGVAISLTLGHLHKSNKALARAKERLEAAHEKLAKRSISLTQANEELQRFAYALAHDLNTPLRGVSALTELLVQRNAGRL